jgi:hypothetical protein
MVPNHIELLIKELSAKLAEHCQSVRVFVTYPSDDGESNTCGYTFGNGNLYAQLGQVNEWLTEQAQNIKTYADYHQRKSLD